MNGCPPRIVKLVELEVLHMRQLLKTKLVDMDLSVRALNCLKAADVETIKHLFERHIIGKIQRTLIVAGQAINLDFEKPPEKGYDMTKSKMKDI